MKKQAYTEPFYWAADGYNYGPWKQGGHVSLVLKSDNYGKGEVVDFYLSEQMARLRVDELIKQARKRTDG